MKKNDLEYLLSNKEAYEIYSTPKTSARRIFIASRNDFKENLWTIIVIDQHSTQNNFCANIIFGAKEAVYLLVNLVNRT